MDWNAVDGAEYYQIGFMSDGKPYQFAATGGPSGVQNSNGVVHQNFFEGKYPYLIASNPELRSFVVRAYKSGYSDFSSPVMFFPNSEPDTSNKKNGIYADTVWSNETGSPSTIMFEKDAVTLNGPYWGGGLGFEGTHPSELAGSSGYLINVYTDPSSSTGFRLVFLSDLGRPILVVQNATPPHYFYFIR
jgi:hypothetical protein